MPLLCSPLRWSPLLLATALLLSLHHLPLTEAQAGSRDLTPEEFSTTVLTKPTFVKFFAPSAAPPLPPLHLQ